jgi:hypothetical protein
MSGWWSVEGELFISNTTRKATYYHVILTSQCLETSRKVPAQTYQLLEKSVERLRYFAPKIFLIKGNFPFLWLVLISRRRTDIEDSNPSRCTILLLYGFRLSLILSGL